MVAVYRAEVSNRQVLSSGDTWQLTLSSSTALVSGRSLPVASLLQAHHCFRRGLYVQAQRIEVSGRQDLVFFGDGDWKKGARTCEAVSETTRGTHCVQQFGTRDVHNVLRTPCQPPGGADLPALGVNILDRATVGNVVRAVGFWLRHTTWRRTRTCPRMINWMSKSSCLWPMLPVVGVHFAGVENQTARKEPRVAQRLRIHVAGARCG